MPSSHWEYSSSLNSSACESVSTIKYEEVILSDFSGKVIKTLYSFHWASKMFTCNLALCSEEAKKPYG